MVRKNIGLLGSGILIIVAAVAAQRCGGSGDDSARNTGTGGTGQTTGTGGSSGSLGTGGSSGAGTGGSGTGLGGSAGMEASVPNQCPLTATTAPNPLLYDGATTGTTCGTRISTPHSGYWFTYHDASDAGPTMMTGAGATGGCGGASDCAYHVVGSGYTIYGAGFGFDINDDAASMAQPFDASPYLGLQFWAKGTVSGTRGANGMPYISAAQTIHVKFLTSTDRQGDDFGGYCVISATEWTSCTLLLDDAKRDGFRDAALPVATDVFDKANLLKLQFEFSKFADPPDAGMLTPVDFDVMVDNVAFY